jgi:phosphoribosylformimino-5-aminoimidazole carboxamide ribotide isomerase
VLVIPAIDIRGGRCVRLLQGRAEQETVFSDDPVAVALRWETEGAPRLHVVDLDGAFGGRPAQSVLLREIAAAVSVPVEVGGGLRDLIAVETALRAGARWAVVGTRAALDPAFLAEACRAFADQVIVAVDAADGRVAVDGWTRVLDLDAVAFARTAAGAGACAILYTDIARDGTERGPSIRSTERVARSAGVPVLASGGVGSLADLRQLARIAGVEGAIVGRALYSGAVDLAAALRAVGRAPDHA